MLAKPTKDIKPCTAKDTTVAIIMANTIGSINLPIKTRLPKARITDI